MTEFHDGTYCVIYSWIDFANKHWKTIIGREGENERLEGRKEERAESGRINKSQAANEVKTFWRPTDSTAPVELEKCEERSIKF